MMQATTTSMRRRSKLPASLPAACTLLVLSLLAVGHAPRHTHAAGVTRVSAVEAGALWKAGYLYLDVRTPQEFAAGHAPGALLVPWVSRTPGQPDAPNPQFLQEVRAALPNPAAKFIAGCQTGHRSAAASAVLASSYAGMVDNRDGWVGWLAAGLPVEVGLPERSVPSAATPGRGPAGT